MSFERPALTDLIARITADLSARLPGATAISRHSNLGVIAHVFAGLAHAQYGHLAWLARQLIPDTAEEEWLERHADVYGIQRRAASVATGTVRATGTDGASIPAGTQLQRSDGVLYEVTSGGVIASGIADLPVSAVAAGSDGNAADASVLRLTLAIAGADSELTAQGEIAGGADPESDTELRVRLLLRIQQPPQGGAAADYVQWALEVPGVTRVWVAPNEAGLGTVNVRFMMDEVRAAFGGAPQGTDSPAPTGDQALVADHLAPLRPVTADVRVLAPVLTPVNVEITDLTPDTAEVRASVEAGLAAMFYHMAEPGGTVRISKIWEAVSLASGEQSHRITAPAGDVAMAGGALAVLGTVTYA